jgi:CheY-like chemotaxis protein
MARILVVDDDRAIRESITLLLSSVGYDVVEAADGRDGLAKISAAHFDVLIVDIFMPGMDGLETIREVRRHQPGLPIIVMSGLAFRSASSSPPDFLTIATKLGAVQALYKPFRPRELLAAIDDRLRERAYSAQAPLDENLDK